MSAALADAPGRERPVLGVMLVGGVVLAALAEAIASTALNLGRADVIGDTAATPDEFAWLEIGYIALKLIGFLFAPWCMTRVPPRRLMIGATIGMGVACGLAMFTTHLDLLSVLRMAQGFAGGLMLVAGQAILFFAYPASRQPLVQALFAIGSVVAPATLAPAFEGWLVDDHAWTWIFFSVVPLSLTGVAMLMADGPAMEAAPRRPLDRIGLFLACVALCCLTFVLSQGNRWDWFEAPRIVWAAVIGMSALLALVGQQWMAEGDGLLDLTAFRSSDFAFAFVVSFVAGAALFGSAFLIPAFAVSVLGFTPTEAGALLLPSTVLFIGALLFAAWLMQARRVPPIATVPFGILAFMGAMWMLSGSTSESGSDDMMAALLLRGLGLGLLFLSINLIAFTRLTRENLASGIGLFNAGRLLGGLGGVAGLQTLIDHHVTANVAVLAANITAGNPAVGDRLAATAALLTARGMDATAAMRAATGLLARSVASQSAVIAFDTAFISVALLFVVAAPVLVTVKVVLSRREAGAQARAR